MYAYIYVCYIYKNTCKVNDQLALQFTSMFTVLYKI